jgi:hyperosmotically inducible periplasmic protein
MKTELLKACFVAGALIVPVAGHSADYDSDRSSPKAFVKDATITAKIKAEMAKDKQVSALHIKVETDNNGVVTLSGTAKSRAEADKAVAIARDVKGVVSVENNIKLTTTER